MNEADAEARHPIRVVARRTGMSLHVLRAWERRYGVVTPRRTAGGQRLYSDADIERLRLLRAAVRGGRAISQVAQLSATELEALVAQDRRSLRVPAPVERPVRALEVGDPGDGQSFLAACLAAAQRLDYESLYRLLLRGVVVLRPRELLEEVIAPLLEEVGERWHRGELTPAQEHAASVAVGRLLAFLLAAYEPAPGAPLLVSSTVAGEQHEFGAMLASVVAADAGWRVLYLGPSLPAEEITRAAALADAEAVAVSAVVDRGAAELVGEVQLLRRQLSPRTRLLVGGRAAALHAGALAAVGVSVSDLDGLRKRLQAEVA